MGGKIYMEEKKRDSIIGTGEGLGGVEELRREGRDMETEIIVRERDIQR